MQKIRGVLNKVTETNVALLAEEVRHLELGEGVGCAGQLVYSRCLQEVHNCHLLAQVVKSNKELKEAFVSNVRPPTEEEQAEDSKKAARMVKILCTVRCEGMVTAAVFDSALRQLSESKSEEVIECIAATQPFKIYISAPTFGILQRKMQDLEPVVSSMRLRFMCEDFLAPLSPGGSDSESSSSSVGPRASSPPVPPTIQRIAASCTVYLSNIDCEANEWDLARVLHSFGEVCKVRLCGNPRQATQYAFVEFMEEKSAKLALSKDGRCLLGKAALRLSRSKSIIQDTCETDAVLSTKGRERPCTFGMVGGCPSLKKLRCSNYQQSQRK